MAAALNSATLNIGIAGASGYVGGELLRWLLPHPNARVSWIASRDKAGQKLADIQRQFLACSDLSYSAPSKVPTHLDFLFVAFPHGESMQYVADIRSAHPHIRIIDLGADFRLSQALFEKTYEKKHAAPAVLKKAVPGFPDIFPESFADAEVVANPGCFAHCSILALAPLAAAKIALGTVRISAITGSSGSGAGVTQRTHHPERHDSLSCYNVFTHRHISEIEQALTSIASNETSPCIRLVPHSGPFSRGIYATCFVTVPDSLDAEELYRSFWKSRAFIRVRADSPRLIDVQGSNFCDMSIHQAGSDVVIVCALDNLGKGAASNAVQCMNLMAGLDAATGLSHSGLVP